MDLTLLYLFAFGLLLLLAGFFLPGIRKIQTARIIGWGLCILTFYFSIAITQEESPLYRMIVIVSLQLISMKILVAIETYHSGMKLNSMQWCAFTLGWFGMRPALFESLPSRRLDSSKLIFKGISRIAAGILLIYLSTLVQRSNVAIFFLAELMLLTGLSLILHFGILNLTAASWRFFGVDVKELFRSPFKSKSLKEFWGKRWNVAFSEMTTLIAYRPLKHKLGKPMAVFAAFLLSGVLHEIAISFPVHSGYGLPFLYFVLHGLLMFAEDKFAIVKRIISHDVLSHVWVMVWLVLPMPLLFHSAFIERVLAPLRNEVLGIFGL
jgi:hypothetical protein